jgi:hypothetical protein
MIRRCLPKAPILGEVMCGTSTLISNMRRFLFLFVLCCIVISGGNSLAAETMNALAEKYAHLVLDLGQHDSDYVDAFYGPAEWKTQAEKEKKSLDAIGIGAIEPVATLPKASDAVAGFPGKSVIALSNSLKSPWRLRCARSPICRRVF